MDAVLARLIELRRFLYTRTGSTVYVLLAGGTKASQTRDIAKAKKMAREFKREKQ
jgi:putative component of toxin-antitoxin plasmid stabilization module